MSLPLDLLKTGAVLVLFIESTHRFEHFKIKTPEWQRNAYAAAAGFILLL